MVTGYAAEINGPDNNGLLDDYGSIKCCCKMKNMPAKEKPPQARTRGGFNQASAPSGQDQPFTASSAAFSVWLGRMTVDSFSTSGM